MTAVKRHKASQQGCKEADIRLVGPSWIKESDKMSSSHMYNTVGLKCFIILGFNSSFYQKNMSRSLHVLYVCSHLFNKVFMSQ